MVKKTKIFSSVLFVLIIVCSAAAIYIFAPALEEEVVLLKKEKRKIEDQFTDSRKDLKRTRTSLENLEEVKKAIEHDNESLKEEARKISLELAREISKREEIQQQLNENALLAHGSQTELTANQKETIDLTNQLNDIIKTKNLFIEKNRLLSQKTEKVELDLEKALERLVELEWVYIKEPPPLQEKPERIKPKEKSLFGKVIIYNTQHNFVIIDVGQEDGVLKDQIFEVFHKERLIGRVRVIMLFERVSAAAVIELDPILILQEI